MRGLNCIKRLQCNLIRHLILSQSLLTRQLRSWTETALSFNAESFCARASHPGARAPMRGASSWLTAMRACATSPCVVRPLGSSPCARTPRHHARCDLMAQVHARVRHITCEPAMRACEVQSAPSKRHIAPHRPRHARARASACELGLGCSAPFARTLVCASMKQ
ncbi:hypothetical protein Hanom_Chr12g01128041 [Helianthus anomalus]